MSISVFELFKIGIGPSSSHTVGPMKATKEFLFILKERLIFDKIFSIKIELLGSLGATGRGHRSDKAIVFGLLGESPRTIDIDKAEKKFEDILKRKKLKLLNEREISFDFENDISLLGKEFLTYHPNAIRFIVYDQNKNGFFTKIYYSIGGGNIICEDDIEENINDNSKKMPYEFNSASQLIKLCKENSMSISDLVMENEKCLRSEKEIKEYLLEVWKVMKDCVDRGCTKNGYLPGIIKIKRRANDLYLKLNKENSSKIIDPLEFMDWINLFALAVSEENACGGRVVTAPTNGAAGIIPAVMHYMVKFVKMSSKEDEENKIIEFLLTSCAIGILYQKNASISGADVGCQGEVGVACSMAAAGLSACMGGGLEQVENAAEIGMEHNLGLTCDPVAGLVQVPCIERNAIASVKAINASRMSLIGDGKHFVSLDSVIKTMFETGKDMMHKYKETSQGGLAVNVKEC